MGVTFATQQGPRAYQEDRVYYHDAVIEKWKLLAVMDGHNGAGVSDFCARNLHKYFPAENVDLEEKLRLLALNLNQATRRLTAGSTLSAVIIPYDKSVVSVAILGDSPVIVLDEGGKIHVSPEHNVRTNIKERKAAESRGGYYDSSGYICFGDHAIQLSRALGDSDFGDVLLREPEIYTVNNPVWVLIASDGLLDPGHKNMKKLLKDIEKLARDNANADTLIAWAEKRGLEDNATAIVWGK